jgi:hypothetical protein
LEFWEFFLPTGVIVADNRETVSGAYITTTEYVKLSTWSMILREELGGNNWNIICRPPEWQW